MSEAVETVKPTREQLRSRRRHPVAAATLSLKHISKRELALGRVLFPPEANSDRRRPQTRGECQGGARPCPYVSCKHHLYLDVSDAGAIKMNFPDLEVWEMGQTCTLDVADNQGETLEIVGGYMNLTRERIRQIEESATTKVRRMAKLGKRHLPLIDFAT